jgi:hypothetical protein
MSSKKNSTPRPKSAKGKAQIDRPHKEAELAEDLAAILAHPFTPSRIYNVLVDELADMFTDVPSYESTDTSEFIERVLTGIRVSGFGA